MNGQTMKGFPYQAGATVQPRKEKEKSIHMRAVKIGMLFDQGKY